MRRIYLLYGIYIYLCIIHTIYGVFRRDGWLTFCEFNSHTQILHTRVHIDNTVDRRHTSLIELWAGGVFWAIHIQCFKNDDQFRE